MSFENESASTAPADVPERSDSGTSTSLPTKFVWPQAGRLLATAIIGGVLAIAPPQAVTDLRARRRDDLISESSTGSVDVDPVLLQEVGALFDRGATEFFQDGMHSKFSRDLLALLARHGRLALRAIAKYLFSGAAKPSVSSEAILRLADFQDPSTFFDRWAILQRALKDSSPTVRDGAILGFASLDDPRARPLLTESRRVEAVNELRQLIDQVLAQIEHTT